MGSFFFLPCHTRLRQENPWSSFSSCLNSVLYSMTRRLYVVSESVLLVATMYQYVIFDIWEQQHNIHGCESIYHYILYEFCCMHHHIYYLFTYLNTIRYLDSLVHDPASNEYYWVASSDNLIGLYQVVLYILLLLSSKMEMVGMTFRNQIRNSCTTYNVTNIRKRSISHHHVGLLCTIYNLIIPKIFSLISFFSYVSWGSQKVRQSHVL